MAFDRLNLAPSLQQFYGHVYCFHCSTTFCLFRYPGDSIWNTYTHLATTNNTDNVSIVKKQHRIPERVDPPNPTEYSSISMEPIWSDDYAKRFVKDQNCLTNLKNFPRRRSQENETKYFHILNRRYWFSQKYLKGM